LSRISEAIGDYLAWARESAGPVKVFAYLLPVAAVLAIVAAVYAQTTKSSSSSSSTKTTTNASAPPTQAPALTPGTPANGTNAGANVTPGANPPGGTNPPPGGTNPPSGGNNPPPVTSPGAGAPPPAGSPAPPPPTATPAASAAPTTYKVVSGDNPTSIATKLKVPAAAQAQWIADMLKLNNTTANALAVGADLKLPPIPGAAPAPAATPGR
jgi:hypothetical protein